jgi:hypothetical protein
MPHPTGILQASGAGLSRTWSRDVNAARNIGLRFLERNRLTEQEVPVQFLRTTNACTSSSRYNYTLPDTAPANNMPRRFKRTPAKIIAT